MRIAHVITRLILGGAQENTLLECEDLSRDYQDDVLLVTGPGLGPEGSLESEAEKRQIRMNVLPMLRRPIHPLRDAQSFLAIRKALQQFAPHVVHTHSGKAGLFARLAARQLRVPAIVHTVHGAPFHEHQSRAARSFFCFLERFAARRCDAIISVADAMTERLVAAKVAPREKFTTIYSGMDVQPFLEADQSRRQVRSRLGFEDEDIVIAKIARLFHLKGHADLIAAAENLREKHPRLKFLLVGDGILRQQLATRISRAGLTERFIFTGLVPPEEIAPLLGAVDVVVHTSLREGLARVLPQAILAGKPVVSYDIDGAGEVIREGDNGFLVPPGDVKQLTAILDRLAANPQLCKQSGGDKQRLARQFDHRTMTEKIRKIYCEVLSQKSFAIETGLSDASPES